jgi:hypothetical protein
MKIKGDCGISLTPSEVYKYFTLASSRRYFIKSAGAFRALDIELTRLSSLYFELSTSMMLRRNTDNISPYRKRDNQRECMCVCVCGGGVVMFLRIVHV